MRASFETGLLGLPVLTLAELGTSDRGGPCRTLWNSSRAWFIFYMACFIPLRSLRSRTAKTMHQNSKSPLKGAISQSIINLTNKINTVVCSQLRHWLVLFKVKWSVLLYSDGFYGSPVKKNSRQRYMWHCNMSQHPAQAVVNERCVL